MSDHVDSSSLAATRAAPRQKVFLPAELVGPEGVRRVHLLNLSASGALLHGEEIPQMGITVRIRCGNELWSARVVWALGKRFGVVHTLPFTPASLNKIVGR